MNPKSSSDGRILVLEPDEQLASAILSALGEAAPAAIVDVARSLEDAQRLVMEAKPDLFVLDLDATSDLGQDFLYDLRTSHPNSRAIILAGVHLASARERAAGVGAIHFLEKPFPHSEFVDLVQALLRPSSKSDSEKFQGTLSDLHIADIIQIKCMSGTTAAIEFTGPAGEKARVFFEHGQVRHATAPGKEGVSAFNEIVTWKGGKISEVASNSHQRTINLDWQVLLMEAMRKIDEEGAAPRASSRAKSSTSRKILVIDDSLMLLSFVKEILTEANYDVMTAPTAAQSLATAKKELPDLILLDYVLPDMKGNEVSRKLMEDPATTKIPVVYMSGFGADLRSAEASNPNVIGFLNKPFTSDLLIKTVETHMPKSPDEPQPAAAAEPESTPDNGAETVESELAPPDPAPTHERTPVVEEQEPANASKEWWTSPQQSETAGPEPGATAAAPEPETGHTRTANFLPAEKSALVIAEAVAESDLPTESVTGGAYFCGDTRFFSLNWAVQTVAKEKLTGTLRAHWHKAPVELLARNGEIVLVTTRDPELYCPEAPITLVNVDADKIKQARAQQAETGAPVFLTLAQQGDILNEPAVQLVQHYGQKLFAQLWTAPRVRFVFEQSEALPDFASNIPSEPDIDHWTLASLRFIQFQELDRKANYDTASIPAYTRDGFERVQNLRLTVAEAQFASQFNGSRSIAQIAKNLRLDLNFARLTLFRFLALEIVECWAPSAAAKPERKGVLQRLTRSIGIGE